jgi:hypothetical protein
MATVVFWWKSRDHGSCPYCGVPSTRVKEIKKITTNEHTQKKHKINKQKRNIKQQQEIKK